MTRSFGPTLLAALIALPAMAALPGAAAQPVVADADPRDCVTNQPFQVDDPKTLWRYEDQAGAFVVGVRDDVLQRWEMATNDCSLLGFLFMCNAIEDVDPTFPTGACTFVAGTMSEILYDGTALVFGSLGGSVAAGIPACVYVESLYGAGPWSCVRRAELMLPLDPVPIPIAGNGRYGVVADSGEGDTTVDIRAGHHSSTHRLPVGVGDLPWPREDSLPTVTAPKLPGGISAP